MNNVITGVRVTGIFPFNRYALQPQDPAEVKPKEPLAEKTGLKFIPWFTPKPRKSQTHPATPTFSEDERACVRGGCHVWISAQSVGAQGTQKGKPQRVKDLETQAGKERPLGLLEVSLSDRNSLGEGQRETWRHSEREIGNV